MAFPRSMLLVKFPTREPTAGPRAPVMSPSGIVCGQVPPFAPVWRVSMGVGGAGLANLRFPTGGAANRIFLKR
jgi:hypothetical protein